MTSRDESAPSRAGVWGLLLAVFYAVFVRFYQAAGGTIGLGGSVPRDLPTFQFTSFVAGVVILLGGVACLVLTTPRLRRAPAWLPMSGGREVPAALLVPLCAVPVLVGGLYAVVHGLGGGVTKLLALLGVAQVPLPTEAWVNLDPVALFLWDLLLYEPWFLAMGVCLLLSLRRYATDEGVSRTAIQRAGRVCTALVAVGTTAFVWMIVTDNLLVL